MASELEVRRLFCVMYPTRTEKLLTKLLTFCYRRGGDEGALSRLGDIADDLRSRSWDRRSRKKK